MIDESGMMRENVLVNKDGLMYLQFESLKKYGSVMTHCFTTRIGGISSGECSTLNLGFNRNDSRNNIVENYIRLCKALNIDINNLVLSSQVHDNKIRIVDEADRGKGIVKESDIIGFDGLITNKRQVALVTFYADCVPLFFYDNTKGVVALAHSGWRGTVKKIGVEAVNRMKENFDCSYGDIEAVIGPSIGLCCFEVGREVYEEFINTFEWSNKLCEETNRGKWMINLQDIIKRCLINSGLKEKNIYVSDICTKCNRDIFFSHRGDNGKTGSMAAVIQLL